MYPKEVRERAGRRILIVQCKDCGQESEVTLPLIGPQVCTCGRTMLVDTDTVNIVAILEAKFRAQRAPGHLQQTKLPRAVRRYMDSH